MKLLLDTHIWIWWQMNPKKLDPAIIKFISNTNNYEQLFLSTISTWEFSKLVAKQRLQISIDGGVWLKQALEMPKLTLLDITPEIAWHSSNLPGTFHEDPADQIIVATARLEGATLITKDSLILKYPHVKCFR